MKSDELLFKGCQSHKNLGKKLKSVKVNNDSVQQRKTENEKNSKTKGRKQERLNARKSLKMKVHKIQGNQCK